MENNNKKILTMSYLALAAIVAYTFGILFESLASIIPGLTAYINSDFVRHIVPVLLGLVTFLILQFNPKINEFCDEVVSEIKKIVWPSRRDTVAMTIVVCVMVVIAGFTLATFDGIAGYLVAQLSKVPLP